MDSAAPDGKFHPDDTFSGRHAGIHRCDGHSHAAFDHLIAVLRRPFRFRFLRLHFRNAPVEKFLLPFRKCTELCLLAFGSCGFYRTDRMADEVDDLLGRRHCAEQLQRLFQMGFIQVDKRVIQNEERLFVFKQRINQRKPHAEIHQVAIAGAVAFRHMDLVILLNRDIEVDIEDSSDRFIAEPDMHVIIEQLFDFAEIPAGKVVLCLSDQLNRPLQRAVLTAHRIPLFIQLADFAHHIRICLHGAVCLTDEFLLL